MQADVLELRSDDGTRLKAYRWGEAERDALIVHGLAEHVGRYQHVAEALVAAGWRATLLELRGHGSSSGKQGHVSRWHEYVEDLQAAARTIQRPFVLVGHSMGGLVALSALAEPISPPVRGVAVSSPLVGVAVEAPKIKLAAARLLSRLLPGLSLTNEIDTSFISRDPEVVRAYEADLLVYGTITPRWFTEMAAAQQQVRADAASRTLPLRVMVATADGITDHEASLEIARSWGGPTSTAIYEGFYHELFNEPEKDQVLAEMIEWMNTLD